MWNNFKKENGCKVEDEECDTRSNEHNLITMTDTKTSLVGDHSKEYLDDNQYEEDLDECAILPVPELQRSQARTQGVFNAPGAIPVNGINTRDAIVNDDSANTDYNFDDDPPVTTTTTTTTTNHNIDEIDPDDAPYPVLEATLYIPTTIYNEVHNNNNNNEIQTAEVSNVIVMDEQYMNRLYENSKNETDQHKVTRRPQHLYLLIAVLAVVTVIGVVFTAAFAAQSRDDDSATTQQGQNGQEGNQEQQGMDGSISNWDRSIHTLALRAELDENKCPQSAVTNVLHISIYCGEDKNTINSTYKIEHELESQIISYTQVQENLIEYTAPLVQNVTNIAIVFGCKTTDKFLGEKSIVSNRIATVETDFNDTDCLGMSKVTGGLYQFCGANGTKDSQSWKLRSAMMEESCDNGTIVSKGNNTFCQASSPMNLTMYDYLRDTDCLNALQRGSNSLYQVDPQNMWPRINPILNTLP